MYHYKLKYIVIVEDENGEFIEETDGYYDTEEEALEFIKDMGDNLY